MGGIITSAEHKYRHPLGRTLQQGGWQDAPVAEWVVYAHPPTPERLLQLGLAGDGLTRLGARASGDAEAWAYVNHGRWLADCPFCGRTQHVPVTDPRFLCTGCLNTAVDGAAVRVFFAAEREQVEAELLRRPLPENRNWTMAETVADLRLENAAYGVG